MKYFVPSDTFYPIPPSISCLLNFIRGKAITVGNIWYKEMNIVELHARTLQYGSLGLIRPRKRLTYGYKPQLFPLSLINFQTNK